MNQDVLALVGQAAATLVDQTVATKGGEGYTPPAAGMCPARLVAYMELGDHERSVGAGKPKVVKPQVKLTFELLGPKHPPKVVDGVSYPVLITEELNAAPGYGPLNEKAGLYKLFKKMNYDGQAKHISQLLGKAFLVTVVHTTKGAGTADAKTYAGLRDESGYLVSPPQQTVLDVNTGEGTIVQINVPPATAPLRLFLWNAAPDIIGKMWQTLFIDGEYKARTDDKGVETAPAKSKNTLQQQVKDALNFKDSPIFQYLQTGGQVLSLGADPLAGSGAPQATQGATAGSAAVAGGTVATQTPAPTQTVSAAPAASDDPLAGVA